MTKLYAHRDPSSLDPYYSAHVAAMTEEGLHAKADIAAELAWRDAQIAKLNSELVAVSDAVWSFTELDAEHTIQCHADDLPEAYRDACAAIDSAKAAFTPPEGLG